MSTSTERAATPEPTVSDARAAEREIARKRLERVREFQAHVVAYVVINAFLVAAWAMTGTGYFWPAWIIGGWGVGLVLDAWNVFVRKPITDEDVDEFLRRANR